MPTTDWLTRSNQDITHGRMDQQPVSRHTRHLANMHLLYITVLTIIISLWRQVDFSNKRLMPWHELHPGPISAEKTVLLDYITPMLPTTLYRATINNHWAIVASTLGILLLQLSVSSVLRSALLCCCCSRLLMPPYRRYSLQAL